MGSATKVATKAAIAEARERARPMHEAWSELHDAFIDVVVPVGVEAGSQTAGARAVQAIAECTTRLREIEADLACERGVDDDEESA